LFCMNQPPGTNVVMSVNPSEVDPEQGVGVGPTGGVGVGVGDGVGVHPTHGVGVTHGPPVTTTLSILHPVPLTLESEHIRKRSLIV
jgi:hypothetical protein